MIIPITTFYPQGIHLMKYTNNIEVSDDIILDYVRDHYNISDIFKYTLQED